MKKEKFLNSLLKAAIVAAGTGIGIAVSKCFSVEEEPNDEMIHEPIEPEVVDVEAVEEVTEG